MASYDLSFRLKHDCPFNDLSKRYPEAVISHWCNNETDILELSSDDPQVYERLQNDFIAFVESLGVHIERRIATESNQQLVITSCVCTHYKSTTRVIQGSNCMDLQPIVYRDGWEWYRAIAFSESDVTDLFRKLDEFSEVEVLSRKANPDASVRDNVVISATSLFGELTGKQLSALTIAVENGYYEVPKKVTTKDIAELFDLPRTTYEEHLRKAESKVIQAMIPYLKLNPSRRPPDQTLVEAQAKDD